MPTNDDIPDPTPFSDPEPPSGPASSSAPHRGACDPRPSKGGTTRAPAAAGPGDMPPILPPTPIPADDPFDITQARVRQSFGDRAAVKKLIIDVAVDKPDKEHFIQVHPVTFVGLLAISNLGGV
jgi:hypothetical protein